MSSTRRRFLIQCAGLLTAGSASLLAACQSPPPPITVTNVPVASQATAPPATPTPQPAAAPTAAPAASPTSVAVTAAAPTPRPAANVVGKPMYQMDPQHTGRSPHTGPRQFVVQRTIDLTAPELRPAEQATVTSRDIQSSTVIGPDGTIYATTFSGWTYALRDSGSARDELELAWRFRPAEGGSPAHGTAAVSRDGSTVYVGYTLGTAPNQKARLYALKAPSSGKDAQIVWQTELGPGASQNSPTLTADGTIYIVDVLGLLSVVDPTNGRVKWSAQTGTSGEDAPFGQTCKCAPAVAPDGTVYTTAVTGSLYAISPPSGNGNQGSIKWAFDFGEHLGSLPLISTPVTNLGNRGQDAIGSGASATIGPDGTVYVGADNSNFYAIDPNGQQKWLFEAERELAGIWTTAALSPDASTLYFGANKGGMYALNTRDGSRQWQFSIFGSIYSSPALDAAGTLFTGSTAGHIFALSAAAGFPFTDLDVEAPVWTAPSVRPDGSLVVGDRYGRIIVLAG